MSYSLEKLPNELIVVATLQADFDIAQEGQVAMAETLALLDAQSEPVYYIFDISKYSPTLEDVISATNFGGVKGNMPAFRHPNVREAIIISRSTMVKLATQGLKAATWSHTTIHVFNTLAEALAYTRR